MLAQAVAQPAQAGLRLATKNRAQRLCWQRGGRLLSVEDTCDQPRHIGERVTVSQQPVLGPAREIGWQGDRGGRRQKMTKLFDTLDAWRERVPGSVEEFRYGFRQQEKDGFGDERGFDRRRAIGGDHEIAHQIPLSNRPVFREVNVAGWGTRHSFEGLDELLSRGRGSGPNDQLDITQVAASGTPPHHLLKGAARKIAITDHVFRVESLGYTELHVTIGEESRSIIFGEEDPAFFRV